MILLFKNYHQQALQFQVLHQKVKISHPKVLQIHDCSPSLQISKQKESKEALQFLIILCHPTMHLW
jgi:hypothetical protein